MADPISKSAMRISENAKLQEAKQLFNQGIAEYKKGNAENAVEIFTIILDSNPDMPEALLNLGNCYFKLNKFDEAADCWNKSLKIEPNQSNCYVNLGMVKYITGDKKAALHNWFSAIKITPDHATALMNIATIYENLGLKFYAFKYYEEYLKYATEKQTMAYNRIFSNLVYHKRIVRHNYKLALRFQKKNQLRNAAIAYIKIIEAYPNYAKSHINLGSICYMANNFDKAVKYWTTGLQLDPSQIITYFNLATAYEKLEEYDYALCAYKRYLEADKNSPKQYEITNRIIDIQKYLVKKSELIQKHLTRAEKYFEHSRFVEALWEYENYLFLKPEKHDQLQGRIEELHVILNPAYHSAKLILQAGDKMLKNRDFDNALKVFNRALILSKDTDLETDCRKKISECAKILKKQFMAVTQNALP